MSGITHVSLDAFEQRARTGAVTTKVDADLRLVVALIAVAREARHSLETRAALVEKARNPAGVSTIEAGRRLEEARTRLEAALASIPA